MHVHQQYLDLWSWQILMLHSLSSVYSCAVEVKTRKNQESKRYVFLSRIHHIYLSCSGFEFPGQQQQVLALYRCLVPVQLNYWDESSDNWNKIYHYPDLLVIVQKTHETSTNIPRYCQASDTLSDYTRQSRRICSPLENRVRISQLNSDAATLSDFFYANRGNLPLQFCPRLHQGHFKKSCDKMSQPDWLTLPQRVIHSDKDIKLRARWGTLGECRQLWSLISDMPDTGDFIRWSQRLVKIVISAPDTLGDFSLIAESWETNSLSQLLFFIWS